MYDSYNNNKFQPCTDFIDAFVNSRSLDACEGLILSVKRLPVAFYNNIGEMNAEDVAYVVLNALLGQQFDAESLRRFAGKWLITNAVSKSHTAKLNTTVIPSNLSEISSRFISLVIEALSLRDIKHINRIVQCGNVANVISLAHALKNVEDVELLTLMAVESMDETSRQELHAAINPPDVVYVKCDELLLARLLQRIYETDGSNMVKDSLLVSNTNVSLVPGQLFVYFDTLRQLRSKEEDVIPTIEYQNTGTEKYAVKLALQLGLPATFVQQESTPQLSSSSHLRVRSVPPTLRAITNSINEYFRAH